MTRNLKVLSLALVAVCAMSAMIASAASAASFTSAGYPSTITGEGGITAAEKFTLGKNDHFATIECNHSTYHGTLSAASSTLTVQPHYSECKAFGLSATVYSTGCQYIFHATSTSSSTVDLECASAQIFIAAGTCEVTVGTQTGLKSAGTKNSGSHVDVTPNISGIAYTTLIDGFLCPLTGTGSRTGATYTSASAITVKGSNGAISVS
jgi:hypothetical protein